MAGRGNLKSPERIEAIVRALRIGNTRRAACQAADLAEDTLARWMKRDAGLCGAVVKAEAEAEQRFLGQVAKAAAEGTWTAAAWWLERRKHQDYGRRDRVDMTIDLRREAERLAAANGLDPDAVMAEAERILADSQ